jgi:hypothetical protein
MHWIGSRNDSHSSIDACFFPHSRDILEEDFAGVPEEDMRKMVYRNLRTLYDFAISRSSDSYRKLW